MTHVSCHDPINPKQRNPMSPMGDILLLLRPKKISGWLPQNFKAIDWITECPRTTKPQGQGLVSIKSRKASKNKKKKTYFCSLPISTYHKSPISTLTPIANAMSRKLRMRKRKLARCRNRLSRLKKRSEERKKQLNDRCNKLSAKFINIITKMDGSNSRRAEVTRQHNDVSGRSTKYRSGMWGTT